ncbi:EutP/PduV family microcompartment system protein [Virgibacillus kimchii]
MQKKNRAMILGGIDAGKTTLTDALLGNVQKPRKVKTQALNYDDWIVDTPGEYIENPLHYRNLMATSMEITHVLFVQDATNEKSIFAPGFSSGINKLSIGAVTKADHENADVNRAVRLLEKAMVSGPIVITSAYTGEGINNILDLVSLNSLKEMKAYVENSSADHMCFYETKRK